MLKKTMSLAMAKTIAKVFNEGGKFIVTPGRFEENFAVGATINPNGFRKFSTKSGMHKNKAVRRKNKPTTYTFGHDRSERGRRKQIMNLATRNRIKENDEWRGGFDDVYLMRLAKKDMGELKGFERQALDTAIACGYGSKAYDEMIEAKRVVAENGSN